MEEKTFLNELSKVLSAAYGEDLTLERENDEVMRINYKCWSKRVSVGGDSRLAMIKDIVRALDY